MLTFVSTFIFVHMLAGTLISKCKWFTYSVSDNSLKHTDIEGLRTRVGLGSHSSQRVIEKASVPYEASFPYDMSEVIPVIITILFVIHLQFDGWTELCAFHIHSSEYL